MSDADAEGWIMDHDVRTLSLYQYVSMHVYVNTLFIYYNNLTIRLLAVFKLNNN